jgi:5-(carboxyamino)imidazole ribonucleotide synthase
MKPILPGATIGVLGSGQLGRMFAISARRMGYRVHTFSPDTDTPTGQIADLEIVAGYDDYAAVEQFARDVDAVTFEFENVSAQAVEAAEKQAPVHPRGEVLFIAQNRLREKTFLEKSGFPVAPFRRVSTPEELSRAVAELGVPCVLKTAGFGYDGKGQTKIENARDVAQAWSTLGAGKKFVEGVLEKWMSFEKEVSVVAARGQDGEFSHFGVVENHHENHILDLTIAPAGIPENIARDAIEIARGVLESLAVVGVLCVEFFVLKNGKLVINELAPRPHNSGHFSFDANVTSQFEQQLRAVCGLSLGSTQQMQPAAMANLLGDLWLENSSGGAPNWNAMLRFPNVKLHLYGKTEARIGRKMGHLTALAGSTPEAVRDVLAARDALRSNKK